MKVVRYAPGVSGEEVLMKRRLKENRKRIPCKYKGVEYATLSAMARKLGVSNPTVTRALKEGHYKGEKIERMEIE